MFRKLLADRTGHFARVGALSVGAAFVAFAVYPYPDSKAPSSPDDWSVKLEMSTQTAAIFAHSCADCHSNSTKWPWYSYVPPASWLIKRDVDAAREHFNASTWLSYTADEKRELLGDVARVIANKEMPLPQYLLLHRSARLSDREGALLLDWAKGRRRLLRNTERQN